MDPVLHIFLQICDKSLQSLLTLAPYLMVGAAAGELLKYTSWTRLVYKGVSNAPLLSTFAAVILGMVSPLCTYGTVPVVLQLRKAGIHISPLAAFLAASVMMNPQLFIITLGGLGWQITLARTLSVLLFGILLGLLLKYIPSDWVVNPNISSEASSAEEILKRTPKSLNFRELAVNSFTSLKFTGFYLVIGVIAGAVVEVLVPGYWITFLFKPGSIISIAAASLLGVPLYACGGGVIPLVRAFLEQGMSRGAALAFLIVGPATRVTPLMALAAVFRPLFIVLYIGLLFSYSIMAGLLFR